MTTIVKGAKTAVIQVAVTYPIVSAYEFEFLKEEPVIRERLDSCTLYLIVQRPLTYFDNVELRDGRIFLEIVDGANPPLKCRIDLGEVGICSPGEIVDVEMSYFRPLLNQTPPYREVAGIKIFRSDGEFIVWWSPQKLLFEMLVRGLRVAIADDGDPLSFLNFDVLYIGQAFDQKVWDRLTGHDRMQKILTVQSPVSASPDARAPFEVSLILLSVVGLTDAVEIPYLGLSASPGTKPILHDVDLDDLDATTRFLTEPLAPLRDEAMTREVEARLIHLFEPSYNRIKFKNYPRIAGGMRAKGYTRTDLEIEDLPAVLRTASYRIEAVTDVSFEDEPDEDGA